MSEQKPDAMQSTQTEVVNTSRRRLTTAALAGPVVLGTLASKQALGAVPYKCTVSGQVSNNYSPNRKDGTCDTLGVSPGCWKQTHTQWPNNNLRSTRFARIFGYSDFGNPNATLIQVLCTQTYKASGITNTKNAPLARAAIANYLNSAKFGSPANFPLSQKEVVDMFKAAVISDPLPNLAHDPSKTTLWYFTMLYGGTTGNVDKGIDATCPVLQGQMLPLNQQCNP